MTIPYDVITDTTRRVLAEELARITESRASAKELDVITDKEANRLQRLALDIKDLLIDIEEARNDCK